MAMMDLADKTNSSCFGGGGSGEDDVDVEVLSASSSAHPTEVADTETAASCCSEVRFNKKELFEPSQFSSLLT